MYAAAKFFLYYHHLGFVFGQVNFTGFCFRYSLLCGYVFLRQLMITDCSSLKPCELLGSNVNGVLAAHMRKSSEQNIGPAFSPQPQISTVSYVSERRSESRNPF
jgi:hypothetical protein